jgi:hypothetical protein
LKAVRTTASERTAASAGWHHVDEDYISGHQHERRALGSLRDRSRSHQPSRALSAFKTWVKGQSVEFERTEVRLVSEAYQYGGTIDAIGRVAGERCILDWKSGEKIYPDALIQVAAYQALWNENYPDSKLGPGVHIVRIAKEHVTSCIGT